MLRAETGLVIPSLDNAPALLEEAQWIWRAFSVLAGRRVINEAGPQAIPMSEIVAYAEYEIILDEERKDMLLHFITLLDHEWLDAVIRRRTKAAKDAERRAQARPRR